MTDFDWDVLYTIPPYSNDDSVRNITGIQDLKNIQTSISNSDSISLFLFVKDDKIVEYLELSRTVADFASSRKVQRNRSRFTLKTKDGWTSAVWVE